VYNRRHRIDERPQPDASDSSGLSEQSERDRRAQYDEHYALAQTLVARSHVPFTSDEVADR
jgi:hypothetical protein